MRDIKDATQTEADQIAEQRRNGTREETLSWSEFELALERAGVIADSEALDEIVIEPHQEVKLKLVQ